MSRQLLCYTRAMNENERSPLHIAVCDADIESVRRLITEGNDPNIRDSAGETPLHYAVASGKEDVEIVRLLLASGAHVNAKNYNCALTPLHNDAEVLERRELIKLLKEYGAEIG